MEYLVAYVNGEKFTPEVSYCDYCDETTTWPGDYYTLNATHSETIRLAEFLNLEIDKSSDNYQFARISVEKEVRGGFFGKKVVDVYYFEYRKTKVEFQSDLVYLEE